MFWWQQISFWKDEKCRCPLTCCKSGTWGTFIYKLLNHCFRRFFQVMVLLKAASSYEKRSHIMDSFTTLTVDQLHLLYYLLNGRNLFGQLIKVNWAYTTGHICTRDTKVEWNQGAYKRKERR
ncbi:hypothetical protein L1987_33284 [Smallanthus sonchifolius]|uniref:Uncharacterized protein n=1 Tax=Smallanthus sonchifolius TaxID=185202 RepID=A0ACB9HRS8_9ASTR|nr:hypothetical protein L1987_33284 [Smallanthus sonchifolius]